MNGGFGARSFVIPPPPRHVRHIALPRPWRARHRPKHPQHGGTAAGDCPKDHVHSYDERYPTQFHANGSTLPAQPALQTGSEPAISSLTRDEIRRIVMDLIG